MQLAAVDLGSNSFRLEIGRVDGSHIDRLDYWKETVRLAAGLDQRGNLTARAIHAACETLRRMNERLRGMPGDQVRAVGTQTLRQANNVNAFLLEAQNALGYPIEVISGREEARLVYEGCMHELPPSDRRRLVVDIGGASTELIVGRGFTADRAESFKVGCVNSSLRFFGSGRIDRLSMQRAEIAAAAELEEAMSSFGAEHWDEAYGSSGTVGAVVETLRAQGWTDGTITVEGLNRLRSALIEAGENRRIRIAGIKPERQDVIAGGVAVLSAVFDTLGVRSMTLARGALRLGVLYDLLGRREDRDTRDAAVERMLKRFKVDQSHAEAVAGLAERLLKSIDPAASDEAQKWLRRSALLHEVGFTISHSDYHKHSAYLVEHSDLPGFSTTDQQRIAALVLGHRGNLKKVRALLDDRADASALLALRLAAVLAHARRGIELPPLTVKMVNDAIEIKLDRRWIAEHPRTEFLLHEEAAQWERVGIDCKVSTR